MGKFFLGIIVTIVVATAGIYTYLHLGYLDFSADAQPSAVESDLARSFVDASVERRAPHQNNPVEPTEANLVEGVHLYKTRCAMCHGAPDRPEKNFGHPFYPPAPLFMRDHPDSADNKNFYIVKYGIRWTGMPAWGNTLSDDQIWKVVAFLSRMEKLPPLVQKEWTQPEPTTIGAQTDPGNGVKTTRALYQ
jgi:mono/diheme cytochrome c family protein